MTGLVLDQLVVGRGNIFRAGPFDLRAGPGTLVALLGPNGGGKTTLLRTMAGLIEPLAGRIERSENGPVALLPAPGSLAPPFSAAHVVALGRAQRARWSLTLRPEDRNAARAALASLGLDGLAARPFDRLSSGQQQLVLLARLVVQDAPLCLLDEPTALLDPAQAAKVEVAIRRLADDGRVVVFATHDVAAARKADIVMTVGSIIASGEPGQLLDPELLNALYGAEFASCPACGQSRALMSRA